MPFAAVAWPCRRLLGSSDQPGGGDTAMSNLFFWIGPLIDARTLWALDDVTVMMLGLMLGGGLGGFLEARRRAVRAKSRVTSRARRD
jgi:hypothetical protein